jgi:uncharacterized zinc-type alcohol dehydrogenase-like protein
MQINAYAAPQAKAPLEPYAYEAEDLGLFGAEIEISHCGLCHSDLHMLDGDWGKNYGTFPMVAGHEIIGTVKAVGSAADASLIGKRVGVGWQRSSCLNCEWCLSKQEQLCDNIEETCVNHYGGFAEKIITDSRFMHIIPDKLASDNAAPLLCAGITVYSPLVRYAKNSAQVGVVGIGGLGHLAVQFANKMGCEVLAFSSSDAKKDEAQELGAHHYVNSSNDAAMKAIRRSCDVIVATAPANVDWIPYLRALRPNGVLCFVAAPSEPISLNVARIFANQAISASSTGGRSEMREMLNFAARHEIKAWTETVPMDSANSALERLRKNDVRYRFVLEQ